MPPPTPPIRLAAPILAGLLAGLGCGPSGLESVEVGDRESVARQITRPDLPAPAPGPATPAARPEGPGQ